MVQLLYLIRPLPRDDLRLDNNGLVGNFTMTYDAGMAAGDYPLYLEISDVQGHNVIFNHEGITLVRA